MDNELIREFLAYQKEQRRQMAADLADYEGGRLILNRFDQKGEPVDRTQEMIADLRMRLANMDRVIAAYEESSGARSPRGSRIGRAGKT